MNVPGCPAVKDVVVMTKTGGTGIVCGVIAAANAREPFKAGADPLVDDRRDPSSIAAYCAGQGIPSDVERTGPDPNPGQGTCYTDCPVWRAEVDRQARGASATLMVAGVTAPYRTQPGDTMTREIRERLAWAERRAA